jgi:hypothetical protein
MGLFNPNGIKKRVCLAFALPPYCRNATNAQEHEAHG